MQAGGTLAADQVVLKPGVGSSYNHAWGKLWKYFLVLLLIGIIYFIISIIPNIPQWVAPFSTHSLFDFFRLFPILTIIVLAYSLLVVNPLGYGMSFAYLKASKGDNVEVKDMFAAFQNYWNAVLAALLVGIIVAVGFILIIVPGIIFACKLIFVPYLVVDRKKDVIEAIKTSWRMTSGHAWKVFLMGLLAIPICIAGLICFGVGIIIAIMWITLAFASLFHAVSTAREAAIQPGVL